MINLVIKGGLGNQMFQYAAAYSLSQENETEIALDLSFMKNRLPVSGFTTREYELDLFNLNLETKTLFGNKFLDKYVSYPFEKALLISGIWEGYVEEDPYKFDGSFFNLSKDIVIEGYFNNYKYFDKYSEEIKKFYSTDKLFDEKFEDIENEIKNRQSVSVNIRRGDYTNDKHKSIFVQLDKDYYSKAIKIIRNKVDNPHFYIFSVDDENWFKEVLDLDKEEYTYIGKEYTGERFKTYLRLISLCKHNIISNSTFAFWGAYLNKNNNKIVITPNKWSNIWSSFEAPQSWKKIKV